MIFSICIFHKIFFLPCFKLYYFVFPMLSFLYFAIFSKILYFFFFFCTDHKPDFQSCSDPLEKNTLYQCPMLNKGRSPEFNITSVLIKAWFGVWDTDILLHQEFSINICSEIMRSTLRQNQCTIDTLQSQRYTSVNGEHSQMLPLYEWPVLV